MINPLPNLPQISRTRPFWEKNKKRPGSGGRTPFSVHYYRGPWEKSTQNDQNPKTPQNPKKNFNPRPKNIYPRKKISDTRPIGQKKIFSQNKITPVFHTKRRRSFQIRILEIRRICFSDTTRRNQSRENTIRKTKNTKTSKIQ